MRTGSALAAALAASPGECGSPPLFERTRPTWPSLRVGGAGGRESGKISLFESPKTAWLGVRMGGAAVKAFAAARAASPGECGRAFAWTRTAPAVVESVG